MSQNRAGRIQGSANPVTLNSSAPPAPVQMLPWNSI
jgi:hypothetical protein